MVNSPGPLVGRSNHYCNPILIELTLWRWASRFGLFTSLFSLANTLFLLLGISVFDWWQYILFTITIFAAEHPHLSTGWHPHFVRLGAPIATSRDLLFIVILRAKSLGLTGITYRMVVRLGWIHIMKSIEIHGEYVSNLSASNFLGAVLEFSESRGMIHRQNSYHTLSVRAHPIHEPVTSFRLAADCKRHHLFAVGNGNILCCLLVC